MPEVDQLVFRILNAVRQHPKTGNSLAEVLKEIAPRRRVGGEIPNHTGAAYIGLSFLRLVATNLITLTDQAGRDVGIKLLKKDLAKNLDYGRGYEIAEMLRGKEQVITVKITPNFSSLQEVLKFSITDMLELGDGYTTKVKPVFGKPDNFPNGDIFVLMPFEKSLRPVYDDHIKLVCERAGLNCQRADDFFGVGEIMQDVWSAIFFCRCVIADCTGRNPNVFYEMGIAHTLGKPVITITQNEVDVPFDIRHRRYIKYEFTPRGMKDFEKSLESMIAGEFD